MIRRSGLISMLALTCYLFCGFSQPNSCNNNKGSGVGPLVAVGAVVIAAAIIVPVVIVHNHHTLKGCVTADHSALQIQQEDSLKLFTVVGDMPGVKPGDLVKLHGTKQKNKGVDQSFVVEKVSKDYGPCKVPVATPIAIETKPDSNQTDRGEDSDLVR